MRFGNREIIDAHGKRVRVGRSATLHDYVKNTKTGETRWVDLSDGVVEKLSVYGTWLKAEAIALGKEADWLIPSKTGSLLDESHVIRAFHRVLDAAGLPRFRVYDLRHTFASGRCRPFESVSMFFLQGMCDGALVDSHRITQSTEPKGSCG